MILVAFLCVDLDGRHELSIIIHAHSPVSKFSFNLQVCSSLIKLYLGNGRCAPCIRGPSISINLYSNQLPVSSHSHNFPLNFPFTLLSALSIHAVENRISFHLKSSSSSSSVFGCFLHSIQNTTLFLFRTIVSLGFNSLTVLWAHPFSHYAIVI